MSNYIQLRSTEQQMKDMNETDFNEMRSEEQQYNTPLNQKNHPELRSEEQDCPKSLNDSINI